MPDNARIIFLPHLCKTEPEAQFTFSLPTITSSAGNKYYAKIGEVAELDQYIGESESLKAIHEAAPGLAPTVFAAGVTDENPNTAAGRPYFLSEYKGMGSLSEKSAELLGERLATELHAFKSTKGYGFHVPTYCGATRQVNGWFETWEECYSSMIENLLLKLKSSRRGSQQLVAKGEEVRSRYVASQRFVSVLIHRRVIPWLLRPLRIEPVLLHGDLWVCCGISLSYTNIELYRAGILALIAPTDSQLYLTLLHTTGITKPSE